MFQSAPRALARGDHRSRRWRDGRACFNPRPAHSRGATRSWTHSLAVVSEFQSAPRALARGDLLVVQLLCGGLEVSIRAPRTRAGRPQSLTQPGQPALVSIRAPRTRAGRHVPGVTFPAPSMFQSAPRALARGDPQSLTQPGQPALVSIRAPRTRAGRPRGAKATGCASRGFNPRPAHSRGATQFLRRVFISQLVSIRAPRTRAGRHSYARYERLFDGFQSAPRALARGDRDQGSKEPVRGRFNPRPAHSRGATPQERVRACPGVVVSIRAPRTRAGRPGGARDRHAAGHVSIRAPRTRAGRLLLLGLVVGSVRVSIRAPRTRAGRPSSSTRTPRRPRFQSAPRALARGDTLEIMY